MSGRSLQATSADERSRRDGRTGNWKSNRAFLPGLAARGSPGGSELFPSGLRDQQPEFLPGERRKLRQRALVPGDRQRGFVLFTRGNDAKFAAVLSQA